MTCDLTAQWTVWQSTDQRALSHEINIVFVASWWWVMKLRHFNTQNITFTWFLHIRSVCSIWLCIPQYYNISLIHFWGTVLGLIYLLFHFFCSVLFSHLLKHPESFILSFRVIAFILYVLPSPNWSTTFILSEIFKSKMTFLWIHHYIKRKILDVLCIILYMFPCNSAVYI